ncbi:hypothetical protein TGRUB_304980 [Toxoplasma gondii RUB]|nr:hypothetical protein TGGT1_304980 [Toxoplasma gondii GT1]KFG33209.1 hypothetical protein TGDOM2_304980 [Toxoplasma gondii GAB2-2007-GAL-DOM2]KFG59213.1 hypothetical protein TGRUB_304980 [Toxoplasma gondii RUB]PIL96996.1 hypothetical protein TGCOUG_304980 [Toxoplasma gondii COUG]RQX67850.1 hypothetical protein TGCAST_304980 [Toxoplasma gondii CAST]
MKSPRPTRRLLRPSQRRKAVHGAKRTGCAWSQRRKRTPRVSPRSYGSSCATHRSINQEETAPATARKYGAPGGEAGDETGGVDKTAFNEGTAAGDAAGSEAGMILRVERTEMPTKKRPLGCRTTPLSLKQKTYHHVPRCVPSIKIDLPLGQLRVNSGGKSPIRRRKFDRSTGNLRKFVSVCRQRTYRQSSEAGATPGTEDTVEGMSADRVSVASFP